MRNDNVPFTEDSCGSQARGPGVDAGFLVACFLECRQSRIFPSSRVTASLPGLNETLGRRKKELNSR